MLADVAGEAAGRVAGAFYAGLAGGKAVDAALVAARGKANAELGMRTREHYAPSLEVRGSPASVLGIGTDIPEAHRRQVLTMPDFKDVPRWVDRRFERRETWARLAAEPMNLLVISGSEATGKTAVAKMLMQRCCLFQHQLRYVDLREKTAPSFLDVLQAIRDGQPAVDPSRPTGPLRALAPLAFESFDRQVDLALGAGREGVNPALPAPAESRQERVLRPVFDAFAAALAEASTARPLVLVLDHVKMEREEFRILEDHLFGRYVRSPSRAVRWVLILSSGLIDGPNAYGIAEVFFGAYHHLRVDGLSVADIDDLFSELLRRNFDMTQVDAHALAGPVHAALRNMARQVPHLEPGKLAGLQTILKDSGLQARAGI